MRNETTLVNFVNKMPIGFSVVHFDVIFPHVHSQTQLLLLLEGACTFQIGEKTYQGSANDMVVINPGTFHRITSKKEATLISVLIDTKGFAVEEEEGEEILFSLNSMEVKDNPRYDTIRYLVYSIIAYNTMENVNSIYTNRAIAFSFFAQARQRFPHEGHRPIHPGGRRLGHDQPRERLRQRALPGMHQPERLERPLQLLPFLPLPALHLDVRGEPS